MYVLIISNINVVECRCFEHSSIIARAVLLIQQEVNIVKMITLYKFRRQKKEWQKYLKLTEQVCLHCLDILRVTLFQPMKVENRLSNKSSNSDFKCIFLKNQCFWMKELGEWFSVLIINTLIPEWMSNFERSDANNNSQCFRS